ncbi:MAG: acid phosphatase type 7 [Thermoleophilaceae bacterium]|nr:acid phosphatase type 7 [Thermoleophilaceae bacterium]
MIRRPPARIALALLIALSGVALVTVLLGGCGGGGAGGQTAAGSGPARGGGAASHEPVIVAAGDIASCSTSADDDTARLVARTPGTVAALGDDAYPSGSPSQYKDCYGPTWGRFKGRTRPAPGNHEYISSPRAAGYFGYFGAAAGGRDGWYSYEVSGWHMVVLNSNCAFVGGCDAGSRQAKWLRADLAAHPARCTLAYWHHPRFSSGERHGDSPFMAPLWQILYDAGADVVLSGHDHGYERFAPKTASGRVDRAHGIREFVVGTGGAGLYPFNPPEHGSERRQTGTYGVLKLSLTGSGYSWRFLRAAGKPFSDSGSGRCH